jgi:hypothetical protein
MRSSFTLAVLSLVTLSLASVQLPIYLPGVGTSYAMNASVSTANPTSTVLVLPCPTSGPNDLLANADCPSNGIVYSIISTTVYRATVGHVTFGCAHKTQRREMSCDYVVAGVSAFGHTYTDLEFITATITAGADRLSKIQEVKSEESASVAVSGMATGTHRDGSNKASATVVYGSVPSETNGAVHKYGVEGSALLAMAGAAVLNAW